MGLDEESCSLVVIHKAQSLVYKDSSGALQYPPDLQILYFLVNERCIRYIFSYFNGRILQICSQGTVSITLYCYLMLKWLRYNSFCFIFTYFSYISRIFLQYYFLDFSITSFILNTLLFDIKEI